MGKNDSVSFLFFSSRTLAWAKACSAKTSSELLDQVLKQTFPIDSKGSIIYAFPVLQINVVRLRGLAHKAITALKVVSRSWLG